MTLWSLKMLEIFSKSRPWLMNLILINCVSGGSGGMKLNFFSRLGIILESLFCPYLIFRFIKCRLMGLDKMRSLFFPIYFSMTWIFFFIFNTKKQVIAKIGFLGVFFCISRRHYDSKSLRKQYAMYFQDVTEFFKRCTLIMTVRSIGQTLTKPLQRQRSLNLRPLRLLFRTPSALANLSLLSDRRITTFPWRCHNEFYWFALVIHLWTFLRTIQKIKANASKL